MAMPRKRKASNKIDKQKLIDDRKKVTVILFKAQSTDEHYHKRLAKELRDVFYKVSNPVSVVKKIQKIVFLKKIFPDLRFQMEHDRFTDTFIHCMKQLMQADVNQYTNAGLEFMGRFVSTFQAEDMHPLFDSVFQWIFKVRILI